MEGATGEEGETGEESEGEATGRPVGMLRGDVPPESLVPPKARLEVEVCDFSLLRRSRVGGGLGEGEREREGGGEREVA